MNTSRILLLTAALGFCACVPDTPPSATSVSQTVRGHQELVVGEDGLALPWFIGGEDKAGICVTPPALQDTSRWRLALDINVHRTDPTYRAPTARQGATLCVDEPWQTADQNVERLCVTIMDDIDGATRQLPCQSVRYSPADPAFDQLSDRRRHLLARAGTHGIAGAFLALADTATAVQRPITALRLTLIAAHFERRDAQPGLAQPVARRLQSPPKWLDNAAAHAIAGQYFYEQAMAALRDDDLTAAWRSAETAYQRFYAVAHEKTIVAATRRAQILLQSGAAEEARRDLARSIALCETRRCEDELLRDAKNTLAWWLANKADATADDLTRAETLLDDALQNTTGAERANVVLNLAYLQTRRGQDPSPWLDDAATLLRDLDGNRAHQLGQWRVYMVAKNAQADNRPDDALAAIQRLNLETAAGPLAARAHHLHGELLRRAGRFDEARSQFAQAIAQHQTPSASLQWVPLSPGQRAADYYALALTAVAQNEPAAAWATLTDLDHVANTTRCALPEDDAVNQQLAKLTATLKALRGPASAARDAQRQAIRVELKLAQRALLRQGKACAATPTHQAVADYRAFAHSDRVVLLRKHADQRVSVARLTRIDARELQAHIEDLDQLIGNEQIDDATWRRVAAPLAAALLPEPGVAYAELTRYALHGHLQRVPVDTLPYDDGWFSDVTTVALAPAGRVAPAVSQPQRKGGVIVIDPSNNLASSRNIARFFADTFPAATVLQGAAAKIDAVTRAVNHARWLHVGAHGELDDDFTDLFALRMADGPLHADVLRRSANGLAFANLSSCRSGRFALTADGGQWGLAGGLARVGVPWVIAARHDLADAAAARFNQDFYRSYQRSGSVPRAYRQASAQLRDAFRAPIRAALMLVGHGGGQNANALTPPLVAPPVSAKTITHRTLSRSP